MLVGPLVLGFAPCSRQILLHSLDTNSAPAATDNNTTTSTTARVVNSPGNAYSRIMLACSAMGSQVCAIVWILIMIFLIYFIDDALYYFAVCSRVCIYSYS